VQRQRHARRPARDLSAVMRHARVRARGRKMRSARTMPAVRPRARGTACATVTRMRPGALSSKMPDAAPYAVLSVAHEAMTPMPVTARADNADKPARAEPRRERGASPHARGTAAPRRRAACRPPSDVAHARRRAPARRLPQFVRCLRGSIYALAPAFSRRARAVRLPMPAARPDVGNPRAQLRVTARL